MPHPSLRSKPCIALIADMVGSREVPRIQRPSVQRRFQEFVAYLNKRYSRSILSRFVITLGDEFQGLLSSATPIPDLMWDIDQRFSDRHLRVGMGLGVLNTPVQREAINIDGPALYYARAAIQTAAEKRSFGGVFRGFGELDPVMNGMARILWFHRSKLTRQQVRIIELLRQGLSQSEAAEELGITRQAVSKQVVSTGWWAYTEAESAWRILFERYVNPMFEKNHAKHRRQ
jgi:SatD family (SatD)